MKIKSDITTYEFSIDDLTEMFAKSLDVSKKVTKIRVVTDYAEQIIGVEVEVDKCKDK